MSMMLCHGCDLLVDTDDDPESLYVLDGDCLCDACRELRAADQAPENEEMEP